MAIGPLEKTERNKRIYKMWKEQKMSFVKIAKIMQISFGRVNQIIQREKNGRKIIKDNTVEIKALKERAVLLSKQGLTTRKIGKILGRSHFWVSLAIKDRQKILK
jgi:DNA-binding CsgD family transcriptional regulator